MPIYPSGVGQFARWKQQRGLIVPGSPASSALSLPGTAGNYASTPDSAANSLTGDTDFRVKVKLGNWADGSSYPSLLMKWPSYAGNGAWQFYISPSGYLNFYARNTGGTQGGAASTAALGFANNTTKWLRATRVAATGLITLYTSDDGSTWTLVGTGSPVTGALFDSTDPVTIGALANGTDGLAPNMNVYYAEMRNGIGGTVVAKFDPSTVTKLGTRNPSSVVSSTGETWTISGSAWDWV